jgi:hypothetical protein
MDPILIYAIFLITGVLLGMFINKSNSNSDFDKIFVHNSHWETNVRGDYGDYKRTDPVFFNILYNKKTNQYKLTGGGSDWDKHPHYSMVFGYFIGLQEGNYECSNGVIYKKS